MPVRPSHLAALVAAVLISNAPRSAIADSAMLAATADSTSTASTTVGPVAAGTPATVPAVLPPTPLAAAEAGYQAADRKSVV